MNYFKIPLRSQNTVAIIFLFDSVCLNFVGLFGGMRVHPLFRLLFDLCIHELYPSLVTCHDSVKKFVPLPVALKKRHLTAGGSGDGSVRVF